MKIIESIKKILNIKEQNSITKYWIISDYHLGHNNIRRYTNRPFKSLEEMNNIIIRNHNKIVREHDIVFYVGDLCFKSGTNRGEGIPNPTKYWLDKLNGNFIIIKGNHDRNNTVKTIIHSCTIDYGGYRMNLVHDPGHAHPKDRYTICGHVHNRWKFKKIDDDHFLLNVSCEQWNYTPISFETLFKAFEKWRRGINEN